MTRTLRKFELPTEEHKARSKEHIEKGKKFLDSVKKYNFANFSQTIMKAAEPKEIIIAGRDPIEKETLFGPVGSIAEGGCIVYATRCVMIQYGIEVNIVDLAKEAVEKGYRSWCFSKYPKTAFYTAEVDVKKVQKKFKSIAGIDNCSTVDDLVKLLGEVSPIGGSAFFMDNVICDYLAKIEMKPVVDTRIESIEEVVENLINGVMVPMRVNNTVYHNDANRKGGHNIILIGIEKGTAIVADSCIGIKQLPVDRLFKAAVANPELIAVWDLLKI